MLNEEELNNNFFSYRKYNIFKRCQTEYYLHYFLAIGGHEVDLAPSLISQVHLLKNIKNENEMLNYIFNRNIKKLFANYYNADMFVKLVLKESYHLENLMLIENYKIDHKPPILFDFYYSTKPIKLIFDEFNLKVKTIAKKLTQNELFINLLKNDKINFSHYEDRVAQIFFSDIQIFNSIVVITQEKNKLNIISIIDNDASHEDLNFILFFQLLYAMHKYKTYPENVNSFLLNTANGDFEKIDNKQVDISKTIATMLKNYQELLTYNNLEDNDYLKLPRNKNYCKECRFQKLCNANNN